MLRLFEAGKIHVESTADLPARLPEYDLALPHEAERLLRLAAGKRRRRTGVRAYSLHGG